MRERTLQNDVTVIGGGLAGVAAAISAARLGSRVALINNRPVLGGNSSSEIRVWVCGATSHGAQKYARETGIMGELFVENQYRNPEGNPHLWDMVVLDAVRAEPNIRLFLNTDVRDVEASGREDERTIQSVTGWQMGSETRWRFESPVFVDATGDGLVGFLAGARFNTGRESRDAFGESWAPDEHDSHMLGSTLFFYTKDVGEVVRFVPPNIAKDITKTSILTHRTVNANANGCDYWWIEWGGELDAVDDNEAIRDELWSVVYGIWDHIKNSGEFDADTLTLEWVGSLPGKREYRRFIGDHVLTQQDVIEQHRFDDSIGFGGWSIDLHPPGGMYSSDAGSKHLFTSGVYHIPYRSLYSANVVNLFMAGRDISATHVAFGTTRVMATCAVTGEAVGTAAALSIRHGASPRSIGQDHLTELRQTLLEQDASLVGAEWTNPRDLVLSAHAHASSTLTAIATEPAEGEAARFVPLVENDLGILLPVDPRIDSVELLLSTDAPTRLEIELWSTALGENHIPVRLIEAATVSVTRTGPGWVSAPFRYVPEHPEDVVIVVRRNRDASIAVLDRPGPYGVMGLLSRAPRTAGDSAHPPTNAWSAAELRRKAPCIRVSPQTRAYDPGQVIGGYQRPFGGPRLWSSEPIADGHEAYVSVEWDSPQSISRIDVIFNDDVDEDLMNLHHHRTPFEVI
ncbi:MAG: FAD-dependent oxidoreductase, partial [Coriobacteriia bacterium]